MGLIFRKEHIVAIERGTKTQTRRLHRRPFKAGKVCRIKKDWIHYMDHTIKIERVYSQRLGDITPEAAEAEGGYTIEEFKEVWEKINGDWNPDFEVTVYEFRLLPPQPRLT